MIQELCSMIIIILNSIWLGLIMASEKKEQKTVNASSSAERLYEIMSGISRINSNESTVDVLYGYISNEKKSNPLSVALSLSELAESVKQDVLLHMAADKSELFLTCFYAVDNILTPVALVAHWNAVKGNISEEVLARMQILSKFLDAQIIEEEISNADLESIKTLVKDLESTLASSELPGELKKILIKEVVRIRYSIEMYAISGAYGVKEALQSTVGAVYANREALDSSEDEGTITRLGELIDKVDAITARAMKLKKIMQHPIKFMLKKMTDPDNESTTD